ncbi:MAG TPA: HD domain-containing protein [Longimicrobiales bacterium]|nr:HD domain-containing protein [Longimicrobiales bacterium]
MLRSGTSSITSASSAGKGLDSVDTRELAGTLDFLRAAEQLKNVTRTSWTSAGHQESVAEHTWRLCLMALVFESEFPSLDFARLIRMCVIHDLGEAIHGDISAVLQGDSDKAENERRDLEELLLPLPDRLRMSILELWDEYEAASSPEARVAKALDKLETIMQHNQGKNPPDFDYAFNLEYGRKHTSDHPLIVAIREILDQETARRAGKRK